MDTTCMLGSRLPGCGPSEPWHSNDAHQAGLDSSVEIGAGARLHMRLAADAFVTAKWWVGPGGAGAVRSGTDNMPGSSLFARHLLSGHFLIVLTS